MDGYSISRHDKLYGDLMLMFNLNRKKAKAVADYILKEVHAAESQRDAARFRSKIIKEAYDVQFRHLKRLQAWATQDPTGPWIKKEIQQWVLNEIKGAMGEQYKPTQWQPETLK